MGETTGIGWTDHTHNSWWGCQKVSEGCKHCYADAFAARVGHGKRLPTIWGGDDTTRKIASEKVWRDPIKWNAQAKAEGRRHRVFTASMSDVFEDRPDLVAPRARLFRLIEATPFLDWQVLTKRPQNMVRLARDAGWSGAWPSNVWAGCTAEDQKNFNARWPHLAKVPARVRFISYEPALELVTFDLRGISWLIVGGESGPGARPFDLAWARSVIAQCHTVGVAAFFKQAGANCYDSGDAPFVRASILERVRLRDSHGGDFAELRSLGYGDDLLVREFPKSVAP